MEEQLPEVSSIVERKSGEFSCNLGSGYGPKASGENGRTYKAIMVEVEKGNYQEYVERVKTYTELRAPEYPVIGDQLDAIWKQLNTDRLNGKDLISEADSLLGAVLAVKAKYPKDA